MKFNISQSQLFHNFTNLVTIQRICYHLPSLCRQYLYDEESRTFSQLRHFVFHKHCLLSVKCIVHHPQETQVQPSDKDSSTVDAHSGTKALALLCSAATDGRVALWHLNPTITGWMQSWTLADPTERSLHSTKPARPVFQFTSEQSPLCVLELHQSGVNGIALANSGKESLVLYLCIGLSSLSPVWSEWHCIGNSGKESLVLYMCRIVISFKYSAIRIRLSMLVIIFPWVKLLWLRGQGS